MPTLGSRSRGKGELRKQAEQITQTTMSLRATDKISSWGLAGLPAVTKKVHQTAVIAAFGTGVTAFTRETLAADPRPYSA